MTLDRNQNWKAMLKRMKHDYIKLTAPNFFKASGSYDMVVKSYEDHSSNGLTRCINDFLLFQGCYSNRIQTQGQARVQNVPRYSLITGKVEHSQKVTFTKGTTRKGTADIDAIISGHPVKIEVKAGRDVQSPDQHKEQARVIAAGGLYLVATSFPQFYEWYQAMFETATK